MSLRLLFVRLTAADVGSLDGDVHKLLNPFGDALALVVTARELA